MKKKSIAPKKSLPAAKKSPRAASKTQPDGPEFWRMRLYVAGQSPRSSAAIANLRKICDEYLPGRYDVEIVDLLRHPEQAKTDQIIAIPTLVKKLPVPVRHIIGDLSATQKVLISLELIDG
ncbi:MAG TPA: circadian clock KaiB family protein [Candidatus Binataceae bacterium]|nr:circadian clock KaiB family protein [Candidatus Binataceae bacterium]